MFLDGVGKELGTKSLHVGAAAVEDDEDMLVRGERRNDQGPRVTQGFAMHCSGG